MTVWSNSEVRTVTQLGYFGCRFVWKCNLTYFFQVNSRTGWKLSYRSLFYWVMLITKIKTYDNISDSSIFCMEIIKAFHFHCLRSAILSNKNTEVTEVKQNLRPWNQNVSLNLNSASLNPFTFGMVSKLKGFAHGMKTLFSTCSSNYLRFTWSEHGQYFIHSLFIFTSTWTQCAKIWSAV